ncbi:aspartate dehydrogenase [Planococcus sp. CP5-4]|uniref:aspartate dehydrogenase n=1 Tax=unclassified Planococcus (in: firmicutes) TaxID=2662419 RepID=UPI001C24C67C|nr:MULTISPECIES: aspartate dehydrogenase [unclassified Planococcus (in: firmicutes)]MBU9675163.1 aspartate dehydrogenase [Planococcus sp. CP5-4_YE]MBV0908877.1 aspartate dehydrogenase [Planococcus sp. CP5-4_UN]MBW6063926.1 aspartate dehydrogenase [Planococcus sp. CP5-4]
MNIGIIGTGNIAAYLLEQVNANYMADGRVTAIFGRNREVGSRLKKRFDIDFHTDLEEFLKKPFDVVVEAVTVDAAGLFLKDVIVHKKDLIVSSIGVFKDTAFLNEMKELAKKNGTEIFLPSGAIGGLDILQSAKALGGLEHVQITTRKSPESLGMESDIEQTIFDGSANEAVEQFPKNINVALVLAIAGIGAEKTKVRIIVDPAIKQNTHTIEARGDFGNMRLQVENNPMQTNPKTSLLAALSILAVLQNKGNALRIGN